jgi:hypothetical protein
MNGRVANLSKVGNPFSSSRPDGVAKDETIALPPFLYFNKSQKKFPVFL